ncbi:MAG: DMT family transporter, partial [Victivallaceae bacterium]
MWQKVGQYFSARQIEGGMIFLTLSCLFWALNYVVYKILVSESNVAPATLVGWIFTLGALVMAVIGSFSIGFKAALFLPRRQIVPVLVQGFCGLGLTNLFILLAEERTSAVNVTMLEALIPVFGLLGSRFLGYKLKKTQIIGMILGLVGCMLVIQALDWRGIRLTALNTGDLLVALGALSWTVYLLWGQRTQKEVNTTLYTVWTMMGAGLGMWIYLLACGQSMLFTPKLETVGLMSFIVLFPTVGAFFFWTKACVMLPLPLLNVTQYLTPLLAVVLAGVILAEKIDFTQSVGMALIVGGIFLDPAIRRKIVEKF